MDAYRKSDMPTAEGRIALWHHNTSVTQSMLANADTHIRIVPSKARLAEKYWEQRGTLFLPQRIRLNTVRAVTVKTNIRMLSGAWTPCRPSIQGFDANLVEKAICVFVNSSLGVLSMLGDRSNKIPSYPQFSLSDLRKLRVPELGQDAVRQMAGAYDALCGQVLLPLPRMNDDPVRRQLDDVVCKALGLLDGERERVANIRRGIALEPSVTGRRYGE